MIHPTVDIHTYLKPGVRVHLAGIGGVSMCPLAEVLRGMPIYNLSTFQTIACYKTVPTPYQLHRRLWYR